MGDWQNQKFAKKKKTKSLYKAKLKNQPKTEIRNAHIKPSFLGVFPKFSCLYSGFKSL